MNAFPTSMLQRVGFHVGSGLDLVVLPLLAPSSAMMLGGRDVTGRQRGPTAVPKGKRGGDLEAGLSGDLHQVIPWVAGKHAWMSPVAFGCW